MRGDVRLLCVNAGGQAAGEQSNKASAGLNQKGSDTDWVVIYFHLDSEPESQCTVVTETRGPLVGRRVVRGRERECAVYYANKPAAEATPAADVEHAEKRAHRKRRY